MLPRKPHRTFTPPLDPNLKPILSQRLHNLLLQPLDSPNHNPKEPYPHKPTNMRQHLAHHEPPQRISRRGIAEQQHKRIQKPIHFRRRRAIRRVARVHADGTQYAGSAYSDALQAPVIGVGFGIGPEEVGAQHGGDGAQVLRCGVGAQARDVVLRRDEVRVRVQVERGRVREGGQVRGGEGIGCGGEEGEQGVDCWREVVAEVEVGCFVGLKGGMGG
jgi:hypothetical protein